MNGLLHTASFRRSLPAAIVLMGVATGSLKAESRNGPPATAAVPDPVITLQISQAALSPLAAKPLYRRSPVRLHVLGTHFTGTADTSGKLNLTLQPSSEHASILLTVRGTCVARTVGRNGPAVIHSTGTTWFTATKTITLHGHRGLDTGPTRIWAKTSTRVNHISSTVGGLRGRIVRRVAGNRSRQLHSQGTEIARQNAQTRIAAAFDRGVEQLVAELQRELYVIEPALREYARVADQRFHIWSTESDLWISLRPEGARGPVVMPVASRPAAPVQLWVRNTLVDPGTVRHARRGLDQILSVGSGGTSEGVPLAVAEVQDWVVLSLDRDAVVTQVAGPENADAPLRR